MLYTIHNLSEMTYCNIQSHHYHQSSLESHHSAHGNWYTADYCIEMLHLSKRLQFKVQVREYKQKLNTLPTLC